MGPRPCVRDARIELTYDALAAALGIPDDVAAINIDHIHGIRLLEARRVTGGSL